MKLTISNLQKRTINQKSLKTLAKKILRHERIKSGQLSVVLVNDRQIQKLNQQFLSRNTATDVLAFDLRAAKTAKALHGEIIISADTAKRNAGLYKTSLKYEINLYLIHGILHLLGFKDARKNEIRLMRRKETELMNLFFK